MEDRILLAESGMCQPYCDILLASGIIIYLGPFTSKYRKSLLEKWFTHINQQSLPRTEQFVIEKAVGCTEMKRNWLLKCLPNDTYSVENAIINEYSRK